MIYTELMVLDIQKINDGVHGYLRIVRISALLLVKYERRRASSAGAMQIFSASFPIDQIPEGRSVAVLALQSVTPYGKN